MIFVKEIQHADPNSGSNFTHHVPCVPTTVEGQTYYMNTWTWRTHCECDSMEFTNCHCYKSLNWLGTFCYMFLPIIMLAVSGLFKFVWGIHSVQWLKWRRNWKQCRKMKPKKESGRIEERNHWRYVTSIVSFIMRITSIQFWCCLFLYLEDLIAE